MCNCIISPGGRLASCDNQHCMRAKGLLWQLHGVELTRAMYAMLRQATATPQPWEQCNGQRSPLRLLPLASQGLTSLCFLTLDSARGCHVGRQPSLAAATAVQACSVLTRAVVAVCCARPGWLSSHLQIAGRHCHSCAAPWQGNVVQQLPGR